MRQAAKQSGKSRIGRCGRTITVLALLSGLIAWPMGGAQTSKADRAEAVYLKKILSFVEWPSGPGIPGEFFQICVVKDFRMAFLLSQELRGFTVDRRTIDVKMIHKEDSIRNCQVLFIGSAEPKVRAKLLQSTGVTRMLTVGDDAGFLEAGGILELEFDGNAIQFAINLPAAKRAGLRIDSRLLALARRVVMEKEAAGS